MDKMHFEEPEMEVIRFNVQEIITSASGGEDGDVETPTEEPENMPDPLL